MLVIIHLTILLIAFLLLLRTDAFSSGGYTVRIKGPPSGGLAWREAPDVPGDAKRRGSVLYVWDEDGALLALVYASADDVRAEDALVRLWRAPDTERGAARDETRDALHMLSAVARVAPKLLYTSGLEHAEELPQVLQHEPQPGQVVPRRETTGRALLAAVLSARARDASTHIHGDAAPSHLGALLENSMNERARAILSDEHVAHGYAWLSPGRGAATAAQVIALILRPGVQADALNGLHARLQQHSIWPHTGHLDARQLYQLLRTPHLADTHDAALMMMLAHSPSAKQLGKLRRHCGAAPGTLRALLLDTLEGPREDIAHTYIAQLGALDALDAKLALRVHSAWLPHLTADTLRDEHLTPARLRTWTALLDNALARAPAHTGLRALALRLFDHTMAHCAPPAPAEEARDDGALDETRRHDLLTTGIWLARLGGDHDLRDGMGVEALERLATWCDAIAASRTTHIPPALDPSAPRHLRRHLHALWSDWGDQDVTILARLLLAIASARSALSNHMSGNAPVTWREEDAALSALLGDHGGPRELAMIRTYPDTFRYSAPNASRQSVARAIKKIEARILQQQEGSLGALSLAEGGAGGALSLTDTNTLDGALTRHEDA